MFKDTRTYIDFNGNERTQDFRFNLTEAEIVEMDLTTEGGLEAMIKKIMDEQDRARLIMLFKDLIRRSYGVLSLDGNHLDKRPEVFEQYSQTQAYSDFFMELAANAQLASDFVNGIIPAKRRVKSEELKSALPETSN